MKTLIRVAVAALAAAAATVAVAPAASAAAPAPCSTTPTYRAEVPTPQAFFGFPLGLGQPRVVTTAESDAYLAAIDAASDRVITGTLATSWGGMPLRYAIVSTEENVRPARLEAIASHIRALREPRVTDRRQAANKARNNPAIVWLAGNVHGGEKSGTDAELRVLYELAARTDCEVLQTLENLVIAINPTQNPDGRELSRRQNLYGFDMNRDWFARTQPETDGKVELLRKYPPVVYVDAHEMGGRQYFFPPNADPIHHDIAHEPVKWINEIGEANKAAFGWNGACGGAIATECYFNYSIYDLFFMGYGDTVPSAGFGAAGMTYEKGSASPVENRVDQQFRTHWAAVRWASSSKERILNEYYAMWAQAVAEGEQGALQPNEVLQPGNTVQFPVPPITIRSYFFPPNRQLGDVRKLVERLRRMDVEVYRLKRAVTVPNARIFGGRSAANLVLPEGTYWVPMAQPQKHWIQTTLGEDPYVPFPYFYDVSSWSNPFLMGIETVYTGDDLRIRSAERVLGPEGGVAGTATGSYTYPLDSSQAAALTFRLLGKGIPVFRDLTTGDASLPAASAPADLADLAVSLGITVSPSASDPVGTELALPAIGLFQGTGISTTAGSHGEVRYVIEQRWRGSFTPITTADVNGNTPSFQGIDVLVVPDGSSSTSGLTAVGQENLRAWVSAGGTYVGLRRQGERTARAALLTSTTERPPPPGFQVLGSHLRVDVDHRSPVGLGRPDEDFEFNNSDPLLNPSTTGVNVLTYPTDARFWFNGFVIGGDALKGTVALTDELYGSGHVVLFAYNPLFRAYEESGEHLFANAVLYPEPVTVARAAPPPGMTDLASVPEVAEAAAAAPQEPDAHVSTWRPFRIEVAAGDVDEALAIAARFGESPRVEEAGDSAYLVLANPEGVDAHEHPFVRQLLDELLASDVEVRSAAL